MEDDGYVTVEAAVVFTALTAVIGLVVAGVVTLATYLGAVGSARDGARAAALGGEAAARTVVTRAAPDAVVEVAAGVDVDGTETRLVRVTVTVPGRLFDVSASAVTVSEPGEPGGR